MKQYMRSEFGIKHYSPCAGQEHDVSCAHGFLRPTASALMATAFDMLLILNYQAKRLRDTESISQP
jgi:hypothetical protein